MATRTRCGAAFSGIVFGSVLLFPTPAVLGEGELFIRGNSDGSEDFSAEITDAIYTLRFLFRGGPEPPCADAADADDNGRIELTDAVFALRFLFQGTDTPPPPSPPATMA